MPCEESQASIVVIVFLSGPCQCNFFAGQPELPIRRIILSDALLCLERLVEETQVDIHRLGTLFV
jgi:hypothetical protein